MADATPPAGGPPISNGAPDAPIPALDIEHELRDSYLTYAMSVIVSRALPDVRDGLKPVQRRVLVAMHDMNLSPGSPTTKCAAIVGRTMERYHPHGDMSIYDTLVRLAQDWVLRYKLVHGQGNFGSVAGLPAAAPRYTEARLMPLAADLLADLDRETVDFIPNYDGKYREPLVLPCRVPNLLINGSDGIAVGMATEIPPHNVKEICGGLIAMIDNPEITLPELIQQHVHGPDFPTGGIIRGRQGIIDGYKTGRGRITLRARCEIIEGKKAQIVIKEVPYQQTRNRLAEQIGELVKDERIKGIDEVRDESAPRLGEPVRLVVYLKKDVDPHLVLNQLYEYSPLQKTVSIILLALADGRPKVLTLKEMMQEFLKHRIQVIRRRTEYMLREAKRRGHFLEGQLIAFSSIDEIIRICRAAPDRNVAKQQLMVMTVAATVLGRALGEEAFTALQREIGVLDEYHMTEQQAEAIVRLQIGQLANLERDEIFREYAGLRGEIQTYEALLTSEATILAEVRQDLEDVRKKYGDARKTEISNEGGSVNLEDLIKEEDVVVSISHGGYVKRMNQNTFRTQHRGGKGVSGGAREEDFIEHFFVASTHAYLLVFTNRGQCHWLKVYDIPEAARTSGGRSIANVLTFRPDEKLESLIPVRHFEENTFLMMATKNGLVKKTELTEYSRPRQGGVIGINLEEGDSLIDVALVRPGDEVVLSTKLGMAIRFSESDARPMGRNTMGVKGISLRAGDELIGMVVADPDGALLTVCENGYGKRTPFGPNTESVEAAGDETADEPEVTEVIAGAGTGDGEETAAVPVSGMRYRRQRRGGKGVKDIKTSDRNGSVVGVVPVRGDTDDVMLITLQGMVTRIKVSEIRIVGRNTQGVRVITPSEGDKLASVAKLAREEVSTDTETPAPAIVDAPPVEPPPTAE
ncbi:DNA gyrase subunit A [Zavarzinella formosa]|uniref:DNA gyrase subunit A n=1 Tax=Zavarzinella formosa TaxID=360055 RepID=UPI0002EAB6C6|nr:DNA gyrase subunit A [Zavarzinella formosa]